VYSGVRKSRFRFWGHTSGKHQIDKATNRKVWWQFWDTYISYQYSYFARINYVIQNPVRHGLVKAAADYPWSANWLRENTSAPFYKTITGFKIDKVNVIDDF
jgi:putative transposase